MQIFYSLLQYIFLFVMLMIPGYIMGKRSRIDDQGTNTMTNLLTDIAMPFLVFSKLLQMDVSDLRLSAILCCLLLPSAVIIGVFLLTVLVFPAKEDRSRYPVNRFCSMMPNCGFIGIPLAAAIFPDRPEITLYISVVNVISTYILLTLGTFVLSENKGDIQPKKLLFHPVLAAIVLGLLGSLLSEAAVGFIGNYAVLLAQLATPVSMLVLGYRLSRLPFGNMLRNKEMYMVILMKLAVMPLLCIGMLFVLKVCRFPLDNSLIMAMLIATAVSTAGSAPALSQRFSLNAEHAAACTIGTTVCSVASIPLMYLLVNAIF
ncbi:MAG: AEC family transporter [Clostridia bacterium]|nr:AEC family transporter [Clostridia bacterium]